MIANESGFDKRNLRLAKMDEEHNPSDGIDESDYKLYRIDITRLNREAVKELSLSTKEKDRSKNLYALGFVYWLYSRNMEHTLAFLSERFKGNPDMLEANLRALKAGYNYGITV
ncbi:MAG: 2-oxoacid:acceptor oxidoreductase family protein [Owenweeksia sp.]|nr:2-oxoacid:acceptor oxidoreductase family protein [Owenweeksia sp.]